MVTFEDVFYYVMNRIIKHKNSNEIMKILEDEMLDTICQCFTGRMKRQIKKFIYLILLTSEHIKKLILIKYII